MVVFGLLSWGFMKLVLTRRYVRAVPGLDRVRLVSILRDGRSSESWTESNS